MKQNTFKLVAPILFAAFILCVGCSQEESPSSTGTAEQIGREIDKAAQEAGKAMQEMQKELGKKMEEAGEKMQDHEHSDSHGH